MIQDASTSGGGLYISELVGGLFNRNAEDVTAGVVSPTSPTTSNQLELVDDDTGNDDTGKSNGSGHEITLVLDGLCSGLGPAPQPRALSPSPFS